MVRFQRPQTRDRASRMALVRACATKYLGVIVATRKNRLTRSKMT
jgi:hypothetical protein